MREPRPALLLLIGEGLLLVLVLAHWLAQPAAERQRVLLEVVRVEQAATPPPTTLLDQGSWLVTHRGQRLRALGGLVGVAAGIGLLEGGERRRRSPYGGVGFAHFAVGHMLLAVTLGAVLGYALVPWPVAPLAVAVGLAGLAWLTLFCLAAGRPHIR